VPVPCFLLFLCFRKVTHEYSQNWTKQKPNIQKFTKASREPKRRWREATGWPHHQGARLAPGPHRPVVRATRPTSDAVPSPIKTPPPPRQEKPTHPITFLETHRDLPPSSTRDQEGPEALLGTLPERGIATGGLLHHHACLQRDE
jgi:hypothetical protein